MAQSDAPVVSIVRCAQIDSLAAVKPQVEQACALVGGLESVIMPGDTVLIKPNMVMGVPYTTGATTNPYVVEALVELSREAGATHVVVGDGACVGYDTMAAFEACGYTALAERQGIELVDFTHDETEYVVNPLAKKMKRIALPRTYMQANVVIDVPVMKTHDSLGASLGLKNMKGLLQTRDKKRFHKWGLAQSLVDLGHVAKPDFTLMDATVAQEGSGPVAGDAVGMGLVLASKDVVAVDAVSAEIMGFALAELDYLRMAAAAGIGRADLAEIEVEGVQIAEVRRPFKRVSIDSAVLEQYGIELVGCDACSGCTNAITSYLVSAVKNGYIDKLANTIFLFGQSVERLPEHRVQGKRVVRVGSCTRKLVGYGHYHPGCAPYLYGLLAELGE